MRNHFSVEREYDIFLVCVCCLSYPASKAHAPCIMSSVDCLAVSYFPSHLLNCTILGEKFLDKKCEF